jgi:nicotinamide-nucleotide amidase
VLGQTVDTNSAWIAQQLAAVGCEVIQHITVGDDQPSIERALRAAVAERCDVLIATGGLGPTEDDLTRHAVAAVCDVPLEMNQSWLNRIVEYFRQRNRPMLERNKIQAMLPKGATMLDNPHGTACGFHLPLREEMTAFYLPGVPKEMKPMFRDHVLPHVRQRSAGGVILQKTLHTFGLGESAVAEMLGEQMLRDRNPSVGTTVANNVVSLRVNAKFPSIEQAEGALTKTIADCYSKLGDLIFGEDDQTLAETAAASLAPSRFTVTTAESCTGGLLAKYLTDVSGSSAYFKQGFITYSNEAKQKRLGVSENLINVHGAVSEPVVIAMARNARRLADADFSLAISGVAGPTGGTPAKPVGTVCIALAHLARAESPGGKNDDREDEVNVIARTFNFAGDRESIRDRAAKMALTMLRFRLLGKPLPF